jgi:hypothetical protein
VGAPYKIDSNRNGREIIALLTGATNKNQPRAATKPAAAKKAASTKKATPVKRAAPTRTTSTRKSATATARKLRRTSGPPTAAEVRKTLEKSFTTVYQNHFFGVKNKVTFQWIGSISVGSPETRLRTASSCYPVKLRVKVTAEDPRDGNISTVERGTNAEIGGYRKMEIFCFYRNGFGEWDYGTYEP